MGARGPDFDRVVSQRGSASAKYHPTTTARGDALRRIEWRETRAAPVGIRRWRAYRGRSAALAPARCGAGIDPLLFVGARRPAVHGRRRTAARQTHLPRGV